MSQTEYFLSDVPHTNVSEIKSDHNSIRAHERRYGYTRDHEPLRISADLDIPLLKLAPCSFKNKTVGGLPPIDTVYVSPATHIGVFLFQRLNVILDFSG